MHRLRRLTSRARSRHSDPGPAPRPLPLAAVSPVLGCDGPALGDKLTIIALIDRLTNACKLLLKLACGQAETKDCKFLFTVTWLDAVLPRPFVQDYAERCSRLRPIGRCEQHSRDWPFPRFGQDRHQSLPGQRAPSAGPPTNSFDMKTPRLSLSTSRAGDPSV